jgi:adhesin/invasin
VAVISDGGGTGGVGRALADSLAVRVTDRYGNPVPGAEVAWSALTGGGAVSPTRSAADSNGIARAQWTLGPSAGTPQSARALVAGLAPIDFSAAATTEGVPLQLAKRGGDGQRGTVGALLADSLGVVLRLPDGRGVANARVVWSVPAGAGTVTPAESRTDANGAAATAWRAGTTPDLVQATATVDEGTLMFTARIEPDAPAAVAAAAGGGLGPLGGVMADSLAVRVTDRYGNPVPGSEVAWAVVAGGGAVSPARSTTDVQGIARTAWTLGWRVGASHTVAASVGTLSPVAFQATASTARVPLQMTRVGGDGQTGPVAAALADSLTVQLKSPSGAPVQGVVVRWAVASGGGSLSAASTPTDAEGMARVRWTLGRTAGPAQVTATFDEGTLAFSAVGAPAAAYVIRVAGGQEQSGTRGTILADSLAVQLIDRYGNGIPGAWMRWRVANGGGYVEADSTMTDAAGRTRVRWAVGMQPGYNRVVASTPALPGYATFTATATAGTLEIVRVNEYLRSGGSSNTTRSIADTLRVRITGPGGQPVVGALVSWG